MDVRILRRRLGRVEPPRARGGRRPRDGPPQLRDHGPALGRVRGADRNRDEREAEGCLLAHPGEGGMGTGRDLRRGPGRGDRGPEGSGRRRDGPGPRRPRLRQVADPPGPRRRIPADDGPDCDRRGPQPIRQAGRAPEAGRRRRGALPERSPRADPGAEAMSVRPVEADGVTLGVEHFGDAAAPLVLLAGGPTMLSWPDALCEALARGGPHVVRDDLRDSGASITVNPKAPAYTLRDLAADAAALASELDDRPAHLAGIGVGGMVAQIAALDHPNAFSALTLAGTRPVAPGPVDDDLPDHDKGTMDRLFSRSMPDWSDRAAVGGFAAAGAETLGDDPAAARATAERIWDRTPGTEPAVQMANQMGIVFSKLDCKPRWRERLPELAIPALVVHGRRDPFFPVGNGEALAREIPGARLLVLEQAATAIPDAAAGEVAAAMLAL